MEKKKWDEIFECVEKSYDIPSDEGFINCAVSCMLGCMSVVYNCVFKGWNENILTIKESLKAVCCASISMAIILGFSFTDENSNRIQALWGSNNRDGDVSGSFTKLFSEFSFELGMLADAVTFKRGEVLVGKFLWFTTLNCFDVVSRFMSEEEFYNLMTGKETEGFIDEICSEA